MTTGYDLVVCNLYVKYPGLVLQPRQSVKDITLHLFSSLYSLSSITHSSPIPIPIRRSMSISAIGTHTHTHTHTPHAEKRVAHSSKHLQPRSSSDSALSPPRGEKRALIYTLFPPNIWDLSWPKVNALI